jgi:CP family cyanate transporter-like MFS transporter
VTVSTPPVDASPEPAHTQKALHRALVLAGILLVAVNLRSPIVAVAPVLDQIVRDLSLSAITAGLLTSLPVLAFALTTAVAATMLSRIGPDVAVGTALLGIIAGVVLRSSGGVGPLFVGTILMGFAITLGNVVVPVLIRRDYAPHRRATVTGLYTAALNVGSMLTLVATVPLSSVVGWRLGLVTWCALAVGAIIVWVMAIGWQRATRPRGIHTTRGTAVRDSPATPAERRTTRRLLWRIVILGIAFGGQAFSYYGLTAWLPQILASLSGLPTSVSSAGSSLFQICAIIGALGVPLLVPRLRTGTIFLMVAALWAAVPIGLLLAPDLWAVWLSCGGIAQGGTFTLVFVVVVNLARSGHEAGRFSALVQGIGYAIGATGPSVLGGLNDLAGNWTVPVVSILVAVAVLAAGTTVATFRIQPTGDLGKRSKSLTKKI